MRLDALAVPGLRAGWRPIRPGDADALLPEEAASLTTGLPASRRASGTARLLARELLRELGAAPCALPKTASGAPRWPAEVTGSLAHDDFIAVAALGRVRDFRGIGIDVEAAEPLPAEMRSLVLTARECDTIAPEHSRHVFAAKEAVYKALNPLDGVFLEYRDIEIDPARGSAAVSGGRTLALRFAALETRIVALAWL